MDNSKESQMRLRNKRNNLLYGYILSRTILLSVIGAFLGSLFFRFTDYIRYSEQYVAQPWYTYLYFRGVIALLAIVVCAIIMIITKRLLNKLVPENIK